MNDLENINEKFYEEANKRKSKLISDMTNEKRKQDVFVRTFVEIKHLSNFLENIKKHTEEKNDEKNKYSVDDFNESNYCVSIREEKKGVIHADFLCFMLFHLYRIENNSVIRYVYFEIYFDNKILGVLMRKSAYNSSNYTFKAFDLDQREWAQAKIPMFTWMQIYRPEIEEIDILPRNIRLLAKSIWDAEDIKRISKEEEARLLKELFSSDVLWPFLSYLMIAHIIPLFPMTELPSFTLNFILQDNTLEGFAVAMRKYVSIFSSMKNHILLEDKVRILDKFIESNDNVGLNYDKDIVYIQYQKENDVVDCAKRLNEWASSQLFLGGHFD